MSRSYKPRTAEEVRKMADLYEKRMSMTEVGAEFGISRQRVDQLFKKFGVKTRQQTASKTFIDAKRKNKRILPKEPLIELYVNQKLSIIEIAAALRATLYELYQSLAAHQIPKRTETGYTRSRLSRELLQQLYLDEQMTADAIAGRLGYAPVTVKQKLWKLGIKKCRRT